MKLQYEPAISVLGIFQDIKMFIQNDAIVFLWWMPKYSAKYKVRVKDKFRSLFGGARRSL